MVERLTASLVGDGIATITLYAGMRWEHCLHVHVNSALQQHSLDLLLWGSASPGSYEGQGWPDQWLVCYSDAIA